MSQGIRFPYPCKQCDCRPEMDGVHAVARMKGRKYCLFEFTCPAGHVTKLTRAEYKSACKAIKEWERARPASAGSVPEAAVGPPEPAPNEPKFIRLPGGAVMIVGEPLAKPIKRPTNGLIVTAFPRFKGKACLQFFQPTYAHPPRLRSDERMREWVESA